VDSRPPVRAARARRLSPDERRELREAALTFAPAVLVGVALRWVLVTYLDWTPRRAMLAGVGTGIALAVLVLRSLRRPRRS
jgi:hypothetical protein